MKIRFADREDLPAMLALEALFPSDRMSAATLRRFLRVPSAAVWVVQEKKEIIGSLVLLTRRHSLQARIYSVVVAPAARGHGLAQALVRGAERHISGTHQRMGLEVRHDNIAARALYRKLGYVEVKRLPAYYDDSADGVRLVKLLRTV